MGYIVLGAPARTVSTPQRDVSPAGTGVLLVCNFVWGARGCYQISYSVSLHAISIMFLAAGSVTGYFSSMCGENTQNLYF